MPSGYPPNFHAEVIDPNLIVLRWERVKCAEQNGRLLGYSIKRYHTEETPFFYTISSEDTLELSLDKNLMPERNYLFTIAAYNGAGVGPFSPPLKVKSPKQVSLHFRKC